jgi:hypothetical protein
VIAFADVSEVFDKDVLALAPDFLEVDGSFGGGFSELQ